jgi:hypothetical protein
MKFSSRGPTSVQGWKQHDSFANTICTNNDGNKLDDIREKRKRISYEKEYFLQMLKNVENESQTAKPFIRNNNYVAQNMGQRYVSHGDTKERKCLDSQNVNNKEHRHFSRQGLTLQTSEGRVGVVDKIIQKNKDVVNASPLSISTTTKDAGEMFNYLLSKTYPSSFHVRGRQKSVSPVRKVSDESNGSNVSNESKQRDIFNQRSSSTTSKNNIIKERILR